MNVKKFSAAVAAALLTVVLALTLAGCAKSAYIKNAFKQAGYEITAVAPSDCTDLTALLKTDEQKADIDKYEVLSFKNNERTATVIIFPSEETMKEVLGETVYETKFDDGYIKGDCYLVKSCTDALHIFKNA